MDVVQKYATTLGYKKPCMKIRQPVGSGMDMQEEALFRSAHNSHFSHSRLFSITMYLDPLEICTTNNRPA